MLRLSVFGIVTIDFEDSLPQEGKLRGSEGMMEAAEEDEEAGRGIFLPSLLKGTKGGGCSAKFLGGEAAGTPLRGDCRNFPCA